MSVEGHSMQPEMMDNTACPYCSPGNLALQNDHLSTQGREKKVQTNKQKSTNHLKGRSKTDLKYPHTSCGEMTEQFLHSSEEKTAGQRIGSSGKLSFKYEDKK